MLGSSARARDRDALLLTAGGLVRIGERLLRETHARERGPRLLVRGADSGFVSGAAWAKTRQLRSDLATIEIEGADHYVSEEAFTILAREIVKFWGRTCES